MTSSKSCADFVTALDSYTPSDVLRDEVLLASFRRFFRKGAVDECFRLLPEEFKSDERFRRIIPLRTPVPATQQPHQPRDTPTPAEEYFRNLIPEEGNRLRRLVKVAQRITEFQIQEVVDPDRVYDEDSIEEIPIIQTGTIIGPGSICDEESILKTSIARATAIFEKISPKQDTKVYRYNLLYFSNAVDQYECVQLALSQGRRKKSIAFDTISRGDKKKREIARRTYSDACRYLECSEIGGPGSLLSMNAAKFESMENLNNEDIQLLCNYRKIHTTVEQQSRSLDFIVVNELVKGLLAQGIESIDITKGLTRLTKLICRYVDTKSLAEESKVLPKPITPDSNEYCRRASQSPAGPGSGLDVRVPSHVIRPEQQGPVPILHNMQSQQAYHAAGPRTNTTKRRRVSGNEVLQPLTVYPIPIPVINDVTTQVEGQRLTNISIRPEQRHYSTRIKRRNISAVFHRASEQQLVRREASGAADSSNEATIGTNVISNDHDFPSPSITNSVDGLRRVITNNHRIKDSMENSVQPINEHKSSEPSLIDKAYESRLLSTTSTHTSMLNHVERDSCGSSAPIRLSDYIDPEMVEDIREWETVWAPGET
ncbi:hypothetical protein COCC4DRAFT_28984 [Bipolaris maydis ATCC 48331]|uniref:Uncharacterized protein n=2 Tax=Cochliobolus heterostrophus TaxID=5016 RepID=M2UD32_COCH5|nr:uncharacterized protein COCC4DRAFT_28984 [Bipolaris maydis ATCC 48331]EMD85883.1 hypothetical protein COCHEDRAFT_1207479 [Bipolaris maydis C5]ENH98757.1 hypothetical protein COCC4DRAFT_28984 [Bipolaris maydis ATCC 48331]KAH7552845.1 hypothetical protein BM1_08796 [Bipolaris maydis]